ncbi:hypothetical protein [Streptomyces luteogriseus]|uniref:hypothetical protein n=1 Tax=Streptomyces luteogriseus TaxID=68233 RepID=UPI00369ADA09
MATPAPGAPSRGGRPRHPRPTAYDDFVQKLRTRSVPAGTAATSSMVKARSDAGDSRTRHWFLDDSGPDFLGCYWHYST